ncbi:hypothetical protein [Viscerimonas tarda]
MIKKILSVILLLVLVFYYIYPTAMPLFDYSFLFTLGISGLVLYAFHKFPYPELISIGLVYLVMFVWAYFCMFLGSSGDTFILEYTKSELGWIFSAYLLISLFFVVHPKGKVHYVMYYMIAAIVLQCIISVAMYMNPDVNDFFVSLQKNDDLVDFKRRITEGDRLLGYGVAFFGAGIACGVGLILLVYVLMTRKLTLLQNLFVSVLYCGVFYVGMLAARTTMVGLAASLVLMVVLLFMRGYKKQFFIHLFLSLFLFAVGYTLCAFYFPDIIDWAFEMFIQYENHGEFRTMSSEGLAEMFMLPENAFDWVFGRGYGNYLFSDVGYTRLWMWFGLPGAILFFYFQYMIMKQAFTQNIELDLMLITMFVFNLVLNYKGLSDLNHFFLLLAFYFLHYKYYIYTPYLYRLGKFNQTKLRYAVQAPSSGRRF